MRQVKAIFHLIDGSTFHAFEREWMTGEGPESVKVQGWFEGEMPDPWIDPPEPKGAYLQGTAIVWWQEPSQLAEQRGDNG